MCLAKRGILVERVQITLTQGTHDRSSFYVWPLLMIITANDYIEQETTTGTDDAIDFAVKLRYFLCVFFNDTRRTDSRIYTT